MDAEQRNFCGNSYAPVECAAHRPVLVTGTRDRRCQTMFAPALPKNPLAK